MQIAELRNRLMNLSEEEREAAFAKVSWRCPS
jgi:hypothetical protein